MPPRPRKELDSKRIQNSLRANILPLVSPFAFYFTIYVTFKSIYMHFASPSQITANLKAVSCRAIWRVRRTDIELARNQIASKRLRLDEILLEMNGVQFFLSAITSQMSNPKLSHDEDSEAPDSYPAIAYFIVYKESDTCNENVQFTALHNEDVETELTPIRVRTGTTTGKEMETAARQLFQVVKDHNNASIQQMLDVSNVYCYRNAGDTSSDDELDSDVELSSNHFPNCPCVLMVVNESDFRTSISAAVEKLQSDGLVVDIASPRVMNLDNPCFSSTSDVVIIIEKENRKMYEAMRPRFISLRRLCQTRRFLLCLREDDGCVQLLAQASGQPDFTR